jgi:hypothetical protein
MVKTMDSIAAVAEQSASGAQQLSASTQQTSAATQQVAAASSDLQRLADKLQELVNAKTSTTKSNKQDKQEPAANESHGWQHQNPVVQPDAYHAAEAGNVAQVHAVHPTNGQSDESR